MADEICLNLEGAEDVVLNLCENDCIVLNSPESEEVILNVCGQVGPPGPGVPSGGLLGQFLRKASNADWDTYWDTLDAADIADLPEAVQDLVAAMLVAGANIALAYNDALGTLTISVTGLVAADIGDFAEAVDDRVATLMQAGANIALTYNDALGTLTIDVVGLTPADIAGFDEAVDDRVANLLVAGANISLTYNDVGNTLTIAVTGLDGTDVSLNTAGFNGILSPADTNVQLAMDTIDDHNHDTRYRNTLGMSNLGNTAGTTGVISGNSLAMFLAGGNNVTLSQSIAGGSATITISGPNTSAQSVQTQGLVTLNGSTGALSVSGGPNVTVGNNASTITISAAAQTVQTQSRFDLTLSGNTSGALAQVSSGTLTLAGGNNITLSQAGNAVTISGANIPAQSVQTQGLVTLNGSTGVLSVSGGPNVTVGNNASTITISAAAQTAQTQDRFNLSLSGNTAGLMAQVSSGTLTLAGGANITLSQNGNAITISGGAGGPGGAAFSGGISTGGNTSGTSGTVSNQLVLAGGNNVTLSQSTGPGGATVTISGPNTSAQSIQTQNMVSVNGSTGAISISGGANVTVGNNASTVTVSVEAQTVQTQNMVSVNGSTGNISFANSNGITFGGNASTITASHNGITSQTAQTVGIYASSNTTGQSSSSTVDARSLSFRGAGIASVGMSAGQVIIDVPVDGAQTSLSFVAGGVVSTTLAGSTLTISATVPAQTNQTAGLYALGNTTQSSSGTQDARSLSFRGEGAASVGVTNGSVVVSAPTQTVQTQNLVTLNGSTGALSVSGGPNITVGNNASTITISAAAQTVQTQDRFNLSLSGNTAGVMAQVSSGTLTLAGGSNITLSQAGNAITINGADTFRAGISTNGNTAGTTGFVTQRLMLVGGSNVTLSQSAAAGFASLTIHGQDQSVQTQNMVSVNGSTGPISISGGANITVGNNASTVTISAAAQSNQSAGLYAVGNTTQSSSGTQDARSLSFRGEGAASVGVTNGSVVVSAPTQTVQTQNRFNLSLSGNTAGVMAQVSSGTLTLAGGNNITLSQAGNAITISAPNLTDAVFSAGISTGGNISGTSGTVSNQLVLVGGNSITLSQSTGAGGATVTISGATTNQSVQTQNMVSVNGSTGAISISGGANVTVGNNASTVTVSVAPQSVQSLGLYGVGNTTHNSSTTLDARTLSFGGRGDITVGYSNGTVQISGSQSVQTQNVVSPAAAGNTYTSGTVLISGGGAVSVGTNGQTITITAPTQTNQTAGLYALGNTTQSSSGTQDARSLSFRGEGAASVGVTGGSVVISSPTQSVQTQNMVSVNGSTGPISISGGANITVGNNASTVTISAAAQSVQTQNRFNLTLSGNTAGVMAEVSSGTLSLAGGNNITLSQNGNAITISGGGGGAAFSGGISNLGNTSGTSGTVSNQIVFAGGNSITLSQSTGAGGATITISGATTTQTNQTAGLYGVGNTTQSSSGTADARSISFRGEGAASVGVSAGSVVISAPTQTVQTQNLVTLNGSTGALSVSGGANVTVGNNASTITISVAPQSVQTQNMVSIEGSTGNIDFADANGITFGFNASTITASHNGLTSQSNQALSGSNGSFTFQTATFGNSNGMSFYTTNGSMVGSYTVPTQTNQTVGLYATGNTTQSTSATQDARSLTFRGEGIASVGASNGSVVISVPSGGGGIAAALSGNTSGVMSTVSSGTLILAGGNNITLSQNGQSVTISAPNLGAGNAFAAGMSNLGSTSGTSGTVSQQIVFVGSSGMRLSQSVNGNSATLSILPPVQTLNIWDNAAWGNTVSGGLGSFVFTGSHRSLFVVPLGDLHEPFPADMTANTMFLNMTASGSTATMSVAFTSAFAFGLYTLNTANGSLALVNSGAASVSTGANNANLSAIIAGQRFFPIVSSQWSSQPVLSAGVQYWLGYLWSSAGALNQTGGLIGHYRYSTVQRSGSFGVSVTANTSMGHAPFYGIYTATTGAMPTSIGAAQLNKVNANAGFVPHIIINQDATASF